jgi:dihydroneopterin aldolase
MTDPRFPDRLSLLGMRHLARHGVEPREKEEAQPFEVDVVLHADLDRAAREDVLAATVDYAALRDLVDAIVTGPSHDLVEALAGAIARAVLAATDAEIVGGVEVRVRKPQALRGDLDGPEVTLVRRRDAG